MVKQKQHLRRYNSGKRKVINKGRRKRYSKKQYQYVGGIIKSKRKENINLQNMSERLKKDPENPEFSDMMRDLKADVALNNQTIDRLNKIYFPKNKH